MATKKQTSKADAHFRRSQVRLARERAGRLTKIKQAIAGAKFFDWELTELERIAFAGFGRTKLGAHPQ